MKKLALTLAASFTVISVSASAEYNKYNEEDYINPYNHTIQEIADSAEMTVEEFKAEYGLPEDMPADTNETAAYYRITVGKMAELNGIPIEDAIAEMKELCGDMEITADTLYKEVEDNIRIGKYIGDIDFSEFKSIYALGESVNENSPFSEIRTIIHRDALYEGGILSYDDGKAVLVMLNGKYLDFDVAPIIINDRVMVPMRNIFEKLGAKVTWDGESKTIFAGRGDDVITMQIGQNYLFKNSEKIETDTPAIIENERALVPIRAVSEALETQVFYNSNTKTVVIH